MRIHNRMTINTQENHRESSGRPPLILRWPVDSSRCLQWKRVPRWPSVTGKRCGPGTSKHQLRGNVTTWNKETLIPCCYVKEKTWTVMSCNPVVQIFRGTRLASSRAPRALSSVSVWSISLLLKLLQDIPESLIFVTRGDKFSDRGSDSPWTPHSWSKTQICPPFQGRDYLTCHSEVVWHCGPLLSVLSDGQWFSDEWDF